MSYELRVRSYELLSYQLRGAEFFLFLIPHS